MYQLIEYKTDIKIRLASDEDRKAFKKAKKTGREYIEVGFHGYTKKAVVVRDE